MAKGNSNKVAKTSGGSRKSHNNKGKNTPFSKMNRVIKHSNPNKLYPKLTKYGKIEVKTVNGNDEKVFITNITPAKTFTMHKLFNKTRIGA